MTRHGQRYVITWSAFLGCLIGFLLTGLRDSSSSHPFAPRPVKALRLLGETEATEER